MTSYASVAQLREYLKSLPTVSGTPNATPAEVTAMDARLQNVLDRATSIVDGVLGYSYAAYSGAASAKTIPGQRTQRLFIPPHEAGTITSVVDTSLTIAPTDYELIYSSDGKRAWLLRGGASAWGYSAYAWMGGRVVVTAKWGYGPVTPDVLEVTLELAVNIWRGATRGMFSDVIGVEGSGAVGYSGLLTGSAKRILDNAAMSYREVTL